MTERLTDEALERLMKMADSLDQSAANADRMVELLQPEFDAFEARTGHNTYVVRVGAVHQRRPLMNSAAR